MSIREAITLRRKQIKLNFLVVGGEKNVSTPGSLWVFWGIFSAIVAVCVSVSRAGKGNKDLHVVVFTSRNASAVQWMRLIRLDD